MSQPKSRNGELFGDEPKVKPESRKEKRAKQVVAHLRHHADDRVTMEQLWLENSSSIETKKHWSGKPGRAACGIELGSGIGVVLVGYITCFDCQRIASKEWMRLASQSTPLRGVDGCEEEE